jgi:Flp pilus assembly protein TadG
MLVTGDNMTKVRNQSGSVLVFITLMIVILLVMVGMGLDTGYLTFSRAVAQRAVDMAALAGAAGLAKVDVAAIQSNIEQLNSTNDYVKSSGNTISGAVNGGSGIGTNVTLVKYDFATNTITNAPVSLANANAVRVALEKTNPYSGNSSNSAVATPSVLTPLINLFGASVSASGSNDLNVSAVATMVGQPGLPIALNGCNIAWEGTNTAIPWNQTPSGGSNPNNSGWTTYLDRSVSSPDVIALIHKISACQGTGTVGIGTNICLNNGSQTPDLREFESLIGTNPDGTPKCYLAPVIPSTSNFTGCDNEILAYAQICPLAICGPGVNASKNQNLCTEPSSFGKYIFATVKKCDVSDPNKPGISSCYSLRLVREYNASTKNY